MIYLDDLSLKLKYRMVNNNAWLFHRRISYIHRDHLNKLVKHDLVDGLPNIKYVKEKLGDACQKGKQTKLSFKPINIVSTSRPLQLLYINLSGPLGTRSFCVNYYALVIVNDFSIFT